MKNPYEEARLDHIDRICRDNRFRYPNMPLREQNEYATISHTIPLQTILNEVHPDTPAEVTNAIEEMILNLCPLMTPAETGEAMIYLRGGTMRQYYYGNHNYVEHLKALWPDRLKQSTSLPDNSLGTQVIEHEASAVTDIDIELNERAVEIANGEIVRSVDAMVPQQIETSLQNLGWKRKVEEKNDEYELEQSELLAKISEFPIGKTEKRNLHKVVFSRLTDREIVSEISFVDRPRTKTEEAEDIRLLNGGDSIDAQVIGYVSAQRIANAKKDSIMVTFDRTDFDTDLSLVMMMSQAADMVLFPNGSYRKDYVAAIINGFRAVNMVVSDPTSWWGWFGFTSLRDINRDVSQWLRYDNVSSGTRRKVVDMLSESARDQLPYIKERSVPLLSDILFTVTANPYLGMVLAYHCGLLDTINLGEIINSPSRLAQILDKIGEITRHPKEKTVQEEDVLILHRWYMAACFDETTDPLVVLDVLRGIEYTQSELEQLRSIGFDPLNSSRSVSYLLPLLIPRGLSYQDIIRQN
ncbi:MAG: hypothetical protein V1922_01430 [bacterium]